MKNEVSSRRQEDQLLQTGFSRLTAIFKSLGVKSMTASGMYIDIQKSFFSKAHLGQCLGGFVRELRRDFKVDISPSSLGFNLTPVETRAKLIKHRITLKQTRGKNIKK